MLSLGLSLSPSSAKFGTMYGIIASFVRMVGAPFIVFVLSSVFLISGLEKNVLILESAMPSAMMSLVFAVLYELDIKLVASACFITTVVSLMALPIIHGLL
jgi:predicted permease